MTLVHAEARIAFSFRERLERRVTPELDETLINPRVEICFGRVYIPSMIVNDENRIHQPVAL
jgi:hypothetical protein